MTAVYREIAHDGNGDGVDAPDVRFEETVCADCGDPIGGHLRVDPYRDHEVPIWSYVFRSPAGTLLCEDCVPYDATIRWIDEEARRG